MGFYCIFVGFQVGHLQIITPKTQDSIRVGYTARKFPTGDIWGCFQPIDLQDHPKNLIFPEKTEAFHPKNYLKNIWGFDPESFGDRGSAEGLHAVLAGAAARWRQRGEPGLGTAGGAGGGAVTAGGGSERKRWCHVLKVGVSLPKFTCTCTLLQTWLWNTLEFQIMAAIDMSKMMGVLLSHGGSPRHHGCFSTKMV